MPLDCTPVTPIWVGLDISQEQVDYFVLNRKENPCGHLPRRASALGRLARSWRRLGVTHAVIEATGGFEREVWESLEKAGIAVTLIQPRRVRQFAGACAIEAKTDRIDAELLARFGAALEPAATPLPGPAMSRYRELLRQLNYLVGERARLRTRTHRVRDALARRSLARVIKSLSTEIEKLEQAVRQALEALPEAAQLAKRLQQAGGVGKKTAWALTAELPELGRLTGKQAASLAGLAPRARDSGTYSGKRSIGAGRPALPGPYTPPSRRCEPTSAYAPSISDSRPLANPNNSDSSLSPDAYSSCSTPWLATVPTGVPLPSLDIVADERGT